jgi:cyclophilin family peptidyl-prolyl cis-trans isomerase
VAVPVGIPVALDGQVLPAEWTDATPVALAGETVAMRAKQVAGTLLLAAFSDRPWPEGARFFFRSVPGETPAAHDAPGAFVLDVEPYEHNRPHALAHRRVGGAWEAAAPVVVRTSSLSTRFALEAAVPLSVLGATDPEDPRASRPLRWHAQWLALATSRPNSTFPEGLDVSASPTTPAPDLASTDRWAKSTGLSHGAGALSKAEWDAFAAADRELAERGVRAHSLYARLRDAGTGESELGKRDGPVGRDLFENLRWIAEREPWTATDVKAYAVGLWRTNRAAEAVAALDPVVSRDRTESDAIYLRAQMAFDAERFDRAAKDLDRVADLSDPRLAPPYRSFAARARELEGALAASNALRRADVAKGDLPLVLLSTSKGDVLLVLLEDDAPRSVAQFVHLVERGFYDGTLFHRVAPNGVAQGGDPKSRDEGCDSAGSGGTSLWIAPDPTPARRFLRGAVGWAMDASKRARSQFFVTTAPKPAIDAAGFPSFAWVLAGMDAVDRLEVCDVLEKARVLRRRPHPYEPEKNY